MNSLSEVLIRELIGPFVDAGTELRIEGQKGSFDVSGRRHFRDFRFGVREGADGALVVPRTKRVVSLAEHLSSGAFADLDRLARSMLPFLKSRLREPSRVVHGSALKMHELEGAPGETTLATNAVDQALYASAEAGTQVTLLHGDAGAGKSWLLMSLALSSAQEYLARKRTRFALYVDAQGVNLRSLSQQIAHQLDIYNGVLRYSEVTPLVRVGALGLIIDGFDELIMPSGYNDTLRALLSYIEDYHGEGSLVASARTSFLHAYASNPVQREPAYPYDFQYIRLSPWGPSERGKYALAQGREDLSTKLEQLAGAQPVNKELLGRPFIVAHVFDILEKGAHIDESRLLETAEEAFIERERLEKLLDSDTERPLLNRPDFERLLEEVAEEMWLLRQNSLDRQTARMVAGLVAESIGLPRSERDLLAQKIDTHSFLEAESGNRIRFPHEIVFSRTLARRLLKWTRRRDMERLAAFLRVAPIKVSMAEQFVSLLSPAGNPVPEVRFAIDCFSKLAARLGQTDSGANVRLNLGSLVTFLLPLRADTDHLRMINLHFGSVAFEGANLVSSEFSQCMFQDIDARGADWSSVTFSNCSPITRITANAGQRFPESLPEVALLVIASADGRNEMVFGTGPARVRLFGSSDETTRPSAPLSDAASEAVEVLTALCKKVQQGHHWLQLGSNTEPKFRSLKRNPQWDTVLGLLESHGMLIREKRSKRGPDAELAHIRKSAEILRAIGGDRASSEVAALLIELRSIH